MEVFKWRCVGVIRTLWFDILLDLIFIINLNLQLILFQFIGEDSFLHRFLDKHGPSVHHVTFKVPDIFEVKEL